MKASGSYSMWWCFLHNKHLAARCIDVWWRDGFGLLFSVLQDYTKTIRSWSVAVTEPNTDTYFWYFCEYIRVADNRRGRLSAKIDCLIVSFFKKGIVHVADVSLAATVLRLRTVWAYSSIASYWGNKPSRQHSLLFHLQPVPERAFVYLNVLATLCLAPISCGVIQHERRPLRTVIGWGESPISHVIYLIYIYIRVNLRQTVVKTKEELITEEQEQRYSV